MPDWFTVAAAAVGIVGGVAGIASFIWQVVTWRRSTHRVVVSRSRAWFGYPNGSTSDELVCVSAANTGSAAVTVVASDGSVVFFDDESLCPGTYAPCGPPGNFCLADPLEITLPEDGGYFVVVEPSINYGSPPAFTYAASITVTP